MEVLGKENYRSSLLDDDSVVKRVVAGEKALFEILLRRHNQKLYRVIRSYLRDQDEIQDAMQNAYLKAFDKLSQFQGNSAFSTWLIRIGINEALLRLKEVKRGKVVPLNSPEIDPEVFNQLADRQMNPEKAIIRTEVQQLLERAIDSLPEKYRIIYVLKEIEGLTNSHVSESLGITDSNIKVRLHRAKSLLKDKLYTMSAPAEIFEFGNNRCDDIVRFVMGAI